MASKQKDKRNLSDLRELIEADLNKFISIAAPYAVMGHCHKEFCEFLMNKEYHFKLGLMPRAHRKSFLDAMYACWLIVKNPAITILIMSATSSLAESQLRVIKTTLTSSIMKKLYPDLINEKEGQREKWTNTEICVDSPLRKHLGIRENTVKAVGLTATVTGAHYDVIIGDDLVAKENNTAVGRLAVAEKYAQLHSVLSVGGYILMVGTRYHPKDLYGSLIECQEDIYDDQGLYLETRPQWHTYQRVVEVDGEFLWPRVMGPDGKKYGFDAKALASIKAGYSNDLTQFYAQYYNDPLQQGASLIQREYFNYYDKTKLYIEDGVCYYGGLPMDLYGSMDLAYSLSASADSSVIAVVGVNKAEVYRVIELDRFKTDKITDYYEHLLRIVKKYKLKKMQIETTAAQEVIAKQLSSFLRRDGESIRLQFFKPKGNKEERIMNTLRAPYEEGRIEHYAGGNCELLEEELLAAKPPHDDLKDALASAISIAVPPRAKRYTQQNPQAMYTPVSRFGGSH